jgi:hypothetical protein
MKMAKSKFTYHQILTYYYSGTNVLKLSALIPKTISSKQPKELVTFETFFENSTAEKME